jgi:hypothetical protein
MHGLQTLALLFFSDDVRMSLAVGTSLAGSPFTLFDMFTSYNDDAATR